MKMWSLTNITLPAAIMAKQESSIKAMAKGNYKMPIKTWLLSIRFQADCFSIKFE
jgi:hypothetical protein